MPDQPTPADAAKLARGLIEPLGDRWAHVQAVAARAVELLPAVSPPDRDLLISAAWLHDIGYAPEIGATGFHPLDGARHLRHLGRPAAVVTLVAHHSGAPVRSRRTRADPGTRGFPDAGGVLPRRPGHRGPDHRPARRSCRLRRTDRGNSGALPGRSPGSPNLDKGGSAAPRVRRANRRTPRGSTKVGAWPIRRPPLTVTPPQYPSPTVGP
jgi:putative nucleotidyltransferase with HDIG domain